MLIGNTWRDAILFDSDNGDGSGEGSGQGSDDFDKARAMATIEKLRGFEKEAKRLAKQLEQYEGKTVLDTEQAGMFEQYKKLGALQDIEKALQERDASKAELTMMKRAQQVRQVAEKMGYNPNVLAQLDTVDSLTYEEKTVVQDGKNVQVVMVSGGKAEQPIALQEYAQAHWADFLPALQPNAQKGATFAPQMSGQTQPFLTPQQIADKQRGKYHAL